MAWLGRARLDLVWRGLAWSGGVRRGRVGHGKVF